MQNDPKESVKKSGELSNNTIVFMIVVALLFDLLQWIMAFMLLDWVVSIYAYLTFFVWFKIKGITLMKPKRFLTASTSLLVELIPIVAALPALTGAVVITALDAKVKKLAPGLDIINK